MRRDREAGAVAGGTGGLGHTGVGDAERVGDRFDRRAGVLGQLVAPPGELDGEIVVAQPGQDTVAPRVEADLVPGRGDGLDVGRRERAVRHARLARRLGQALRELLALRGWQRLHRVAGLARAHPRPQRSGQLQPAVEDRLEVRRPARLSAAPEEERRRGVRAGEQVERHVPVRAKLVVERDRHREWLAPAAHPPRRRSARPGPGCSGRRGQRAGWNSSVPCAGTT